MSLFTPEDLFAALEGKKIILHLGNVFFNERDFEEVARWQEMGAKTRPWYDEELWEIIRQRRERAGLEMPKQGWEVHVLSMLDEYWVTDETGEGEYDAFPEGLRELCRQSI